MNHYEMQIESSQLKKRRLNRGWTQQHLADISGISLRTIQRAETNNNTSLETLNALSAVFEISHDELKMMPMTDYEKTSIINKGWCIALVAIVVAQLLTILSVRILLGTVNITWLKLLLISWFVILLAWLVYRLTYVVHGLKNHEQLTDFINKVKQ